MKFVILAFTALAISYSFSCKKVESNDLKDDVGYYQFYQVDYDKTANSIRAMAAFNIKNATGAKIVLGNGASIKLNGAEPTTSMSDKSTYHWTITGQPEATFVLTKNSGSQIKNTITKEDIGDINFDTFPATASRAAGFEFTWKGTPLKTGDEVYVSLSDEKFLNRLVEGNTIKITPDELKSVATGTKLTVTIYRQRKMDIKQKDNDAMGTISTTISIDKNIMVVE